MAYEMGLYQPEWTNAIGFATLANLQLASGSKGFSAVDFLPGEKREKPDWRAQKAMMEKMRQSRR